MSINTKAILFGDINHEEITATLYGKLGIKVTDVEVKRDNLSNYSILHFADPAEPTKTRMLFAFHGSIGDYRDVFDGERTLLDLGAWGSSVTIMEALAGTYGGFVLPSDFMDADNWIRFEPQAENAVDFDPATNLKIALSKVLPPAQALLMSKVIDDPEKLDFVMEQLRIARTDAVSEDEAIRRAVAYVKAGADIIQPISKCFKSIAGLRKLRAACGVPLSLQLLGWLERDLSRAEIEEVAGIATFPLVPLMSAAHAMRENLKVLARDKSSKALPLAVMDHNAFSVFIGFPKIEELQNKYLRFLPSRAAE